MKWRFVTGILAAASVLLVAKSAGAQEIQLTGPLKGAPAVRQLRLYREGRFELAPAVSFTLLDEYRRTILPGARLTYNIKDWIGVGVWGGVGAVSLTTDLTDQIDQVALRNQFTAVNVSPQRGDNGFPGQTAKLSWVAVPQLTFVPFRGKLAIFQKIFVDTDFYVAAGPGFVGLEERDDCNVAGKPACSDSKSFTKKSRMAIAPSFGVGFTFYMSGLASLGLEYRALPFSWNRAGFDQRGGGANGKFPDQKINDEDQTFKWNQMITVSVGLHFPTAPKLSE